MCKNTHRYFDVNFLKRHLKRNGGGVQSTKKDPLALSYIQNKNHKYLGRHVKLAPINYIKNEVAEYYSAKKGSPKLQSAISPKRACTYHTPMNSPKNMQMQISPIFQNRKNVIINHFALTQDLFLGGCGPSYRLYKSLRLVPRLVLVELWTVISTI